MEAGGITQHIGAFLGMIQVYVHVCKAIFSYTMGWLADSLLGEMLQHTRFICKQLKRKA